MNDSAAEISGKRNSLDEQVEIVAGMLPRLARAMNCAIAELSQELGVTPAQVKVLLQLSQREQMTVGEIADAIYVSMPAASEIVDRLVDLGHLLRTPDPDDRRRVLVTAAPESRRAIDRLVHMRRSQVREALLRLDLEERPVAARALEALIAELSRNNDLRAPAGRKTARPA